VYKLLISISYLVIPLWLAADTPEEYFHRGAGAYVFGAKQKARVEIETGLEKYPTDPKLQQMSELLKDKDSDEARQQPQDKQDDKNQESKDQKDQQQNQKDSSKDQKNKEQKQPQEKPDPSKQDQKQNQEQEQSKQKEDQKDNTGNSDQQKDEAKQDKQEGRSQGDEPSDSQTETNQLQVVAGQMTAQQAQQLLDSAKGEEKALIFVPTKRNESRNRIFKDW
jgi:Ca-activated chloride channel family protein